MQSSWNCEIKNDMSRIIEMKNLLFGRSSEFILVESILKVTGVKSDRKKKKKIQKLYYFRLKQFLFSHRIELIERKHIYFQKNYFYKRYLGTGTSQVGRQIRGGIIGLKRNILAEGFIGIYSCGNGVDRSYIRKIITGK